ncbi:MAG: hypothetical protein DPW09_38480 [Anaerolineae bacterium]|nr:hypothetical protein [Anaerolineae bacterium]
MNIRSFLLVGGLIGLVIVGALVWYLASPLFINRTVDEAFPFEAPSQEDLAQMSEGEVEQARAGLREAIPSQAEMEKMAEAEQQAVATRVMEAAAALPDKAMEEPMPADQPTVVAQGQFQDADSFHQGSGAATIYQLPDGNLVLRFEDFTVTNGPDLHVLLAENPTPTSSSDLGEYLDLGSLKGNIGSQNYDIPARTDLSRFKSIVIYCQPFHVVFATAPLVN